MVYRMSHPRHGEMDIYTEAEIAVNEAHGWKLMEKNAARENTSLAEQYQEKFGKPPHHKMKPETIEKALRA